MYRSPTLPMGTALEGGKGGGVGSWMQGGGGGGGGCH